MTPETYCTLCVYAVPVFAACFVLDFAITWTAQAWRSVCDEWLWLANGWQQVAIDYKTLSNTWREKALARHESVTSWRRNFFKLNKWDLN